MGALAQELEKKRESASTDRAVNVLDLTLISEVSSDNIHVDYGSPGLRAADANVRGLYSQYQAAFFGATHFLFLLRSATAGCKIVAVLRAPDETRNAYYVRARVCWVPPPADRRSPSELGDQYVRHV